MATDSVTQTVKRTAARQVQRRWQVQFRRRMQGLAPERWCCVGVDIGKYEHVAVVTDGWGHLLDEPFRFSLYQSDVECFFHRVAQAGAGRASPLVAMEPTGHYHEPLAYEASCRYGRSQVFLVQSYDVSERRKTWNQGSFKNDEVDACIIAQVLREGHGRPYQPPQGVYLRLYHLERYRLAREQAATRLKNQIIGHVDRLYPGVLVRDWRLARRYRPLFRDLWQAKTPRRLFTLFPDPHRLRQHTPKSLCQQFRAAGYWMNRPYAAKILAGVRRSCLPNPEIVAVRSQMLLSDLESLVEEERRVTDTEVEMAACLDVTWGRWLRPTGVPAALLASLVATIGDIGQYHSPRQLFGRSGLHSGCDDSGTRQRRGQGRRIVAPGDRHLRRQLMRFTFSMVPRYPALQRHKARLLQRGLSRMGAYIALARRLSGVVFSVASREVLFEPDRFT